MISTTSGAGATVPKTFPQTDTNCSAGSKKKAGRGPALIIGAGSENRTRVCSLEGCRSTIELHPQCPWVLPIISQLRKPMWPLNVPPNPMTAEALELSDLRFRQFASACGQGISVLTYRVKACIALLKNFVQMSTVQSASQLVGNPLQWQPLSSSDWQL